MSKRNKITVRLVGKPALLDEEIRHKLNALDATCFAADRLYNKDRSFWWIAYVDDVMAGFAGLTPNEEKGVGFLCRAGVCRKFNGLGLQRRLIDVRVRHAKRLGMKGVSTYVATHNWKSMANLIRAGLWIVELNDNYTTFEMKI